MTAETRTRLEAWAEELVAVARRMAEADLRSPDAEVDRLIERQQFLCDALGRHAGVALPAAILERVREAKTLIDASQHAAKAARDEVSLELRSVRGAHAHARRTPPRAPAFVSRRA